MGKCAAAQRGKLPQNAAKRGKMQQLGTQKELHVRLSPEMRERVEQYQRKFRKKRRLYTLADTIRCMLENELDRCKIEGGTDEPELS